MKLKNRMIGCDGCDKWYHWSCVGIDHDNKPGKDDDWYCRKCTARRSEAGEWKPEKADNYNYNYNFIDCIDLHIPTYS